MSSFPSFFVCQFLFFNAEGADVFHRLRLLFPPILVKLFSIELPHIKRCTVFFVGLAGTEPRRCVRNIRIFGNEPLEITILGNISGRSINKSIIVSPVNAVFLSENFDHLRFHPQIVLCSNDGIVLDIAVLIGVLANE